MASHLYYQINAAWRTRLFPKM